VGSGQRFYTAVAMRERRRVTGSIDGGPRGLLDHVDIDRVALGPQGQPELLLERGVASD
jgi:hypothetical protein